MDVPADGRRRGDLWKQPGQGSNTSASANERAVKLEPDPALGYDGAYWVGALSASAPAFPPRGTREAYSASISTRAWRSSSSSQGSGMGGGHPPRLRGGRELA